ncbi:hypothetical protein MX659_09015, partial [Coriobacteriia bacterium Es71-Z0120]|uniref:hypothetical protein n=1 Tax=Parvivirga hydrogeniphila TaxID=2939460 RepID=UPI002260838D
SPYQYCGGDPVGKVDPSGEAAQLYGGAFAWSWWLASEWRKGFVTIRADVIGFIEEASGLLMVRAVYRYRTWRKYEMTTGGIKVSAPRRKEWWSHYELYAGRRLVAVGDYYRWDMPLLGPRSRTGGKNFSWKRPW